MGALARHCAVSRETARKWLAGLALNEPKLVHSLRRMPEKKVRVPMALIDLLD